MSEPSTPAAVANADSDAERRNRGRRAQEDGLGERRNRKPRPVWLSILRYGGTILVLLATILFTVMRVHPIYTGSAPLAQQVIARGIAPGAEAISDTVKDKVLAQLMRDSTFREDRLNFAKDLMRTGRIDQARADSIATYAVREAYVRHIPPALIFGVMLTENSRFVSRAQSNVGAVGLMQVYPKVWLKALSKDLGSDLASDSTNLKYGIFILREYIKPKGLALTQGEVDKGLLRYNGCVHGSNTPNCHTYPNKVAKYVEDQAQSLCGGKGFYACIARPFVNGLLGERTD